LEFEASLHELVGKAAVDPAKECHAKRDIKLAQPAAVGP
jgi:hypothetical protein